MCSLHAFVVFFRRAKKKKLWVKIEKILECKESATRLVKFKVKLSGVKKPVWVPGINLSRGVISNYKAGLALPAKANAHVDRGYAEQQKSFFTKHAKSLRKSKTRTPISVASKVQKWCAKA